MRVLVVLSLLAGIGVLAGVVALALRSETTEQTSAGEGRWLLYDGVGFQVVVFDSKGSMIPYPSTPLFSSGHASVHGGSLTIQIDGQQTAAGETYSTSFTGTRLADEKVAGIIPEQLSQSAVDSVYFGNFERTDVAGLSLPAAAIRLASSSSTPSKEILQYAEKCADCGFSIVVDALLRDPVLNMFLVHIAITNSEEKGVLNFQRSTNTVYSLTRNQAGEFAARLETESKEEGFRTEALLTAVAAKSFSAGTDSRPVLGVGVAWEAWLVCNGTLPPDTTAFFIMIRGIQSTSGSSSWVSETAGQPFVKLGGK